MKEYPNVKKLLDNLDRRPDSVWQSDGGGVLSAHAAFEIRALLAERDKFHACWTEAAATNRHLLDEMSKAVGHARAMEADRDALKAKAEARPDAPGRRLREYVSAVEWDNADDQRIYRVNNGVVEVRKKGVSKWSQAAMIYAEDVAGVADLLANPEEPQPVEALEAVVREWWWSPADTPTAESLPDLCTRLRTWLAQQPTPTLTAAQHVAALVGMGAKQYSNIADDEMRFVGRRDLVLLPREVTP